MKHDFADGKYTVINDNGKLTALRHGEPWARDLTGDNLVYWMLIEVDELKAQRDEALALLAKVTPLADERVSQELSDGAVGMSEDLAAVHAAQALLARAQSAAQPSAPAADQPGT